MRDNVLGVRKGGGTDRSCAGRQHTFLDRDVSGSAPETCTNLRSRPEGGCVRGSVGAPSARGGARNVARERCGSGADGGWSRVGTGASRLSRGRSGREGGQSGRGEGEGRRGGGKSTCSRAKITCGGSGSGGAPGEMTRAHPQSAMRRVPIAGGGRKSAVGRRGVGGGPGESEGEGRGAGAGPGQRDCGRSGPQPWSSRATSISQGAGAPSGCQRRSSRSTRGKRSAGVQISTAASSGSTIQ